MNDDEKPAWTKIGFDQSVNDLIANGPSAPVGIAVQSVEKPAVTVLAQFDTGAAGCGIGPRLAKRLNLQPVDSGVIHEAGREPISADFFAVRLFLPRMDIKLDIAGLPSLSPPHDILIGRNVLARVRLLVDFTTGTTQLHIKNDP